MVEFSSWVFGVFMMIVSNKNEKNDCAGASVSLLLVIVLAFSSLCSGGGGGRGEGGGGLQCSE